MNHYHMIMIRQQSAYKGKNCASSQRTQRDLPSNSQLYYIRTSLNPSGARYTSFLLPHSPKSSTDLSIRMLAGTPSLPEINRHPPTLCFVITNHHSSSTLDHWHLTSETFLGQMSFHFPCHQSFLHLQYFFSTFNIKFIFL